MGQTLIISGLYRIAVAWWVRPRSARITSCSSLRDSLVIHKGDVTDALQMMQLVRRVKPDEIYHLAAQAHVSQSFDSPAYTMEVNALGTLNMLEAVVSSDLRHHTRLYNVCALMFHSRCGLTDGVCVIGLNVGNIRGHG